MDCVLWEVRNKAVCTIKTESQSLRNFKCHRNCPYNSFIWRPYGWL